MAKSRYDFFETVYNDDLQHTQKGFIDNDFISELKEVESVIYKIPLGEQFRPDIIAHKFYGDGKYYWVLVYRNEIYDSPEGFYVNREIRVPTPEIIGTLL